MACDDRPHGPEGEFRMTPLERHARWLLRFYPAVYRRGRGEEIISTLLEATPDGRMWPRVRDIRALVVGGLKARAAQNRQRTVSANLRVAVMAGLAMYLSYWIAAYLDGVVQGWRLPTSVHVSGLTTWLAAVTALLVGATVVVAWTAPRAAALAGAFAASACVVSFALVIGGPAALLRPRLLQVLALAGLAALAPRVGHPSRHWLWLPGVIAISTFLVTMDVGYLWLALGVMPALPLLAMAAGGILWVGVDARLIVAVLTYLAVTALQMPVAEISYFPGLLATLPFLGLVVAIAAPAVWLLRRQSAHPVR
jgi:hypothetical protein